MEEGRLPPAWISEYVAAQSEWAAQLLRDLAKNNSVDKLNTAVLNSAEGLAFIRTRKGGWVGVSSEFARPSAFRPQLRPDSAGHENTRK